MSEQDFYKVLFDENIFSPFSYNLGEIPSKITFCEFTFEFVKSKESFGENYVMVSYYKEDANLPEELLKSITGKYITSECGIASKPNSITKNTITIPSKNLYIYRKIGLQVFILEMKRYFNRIYRSRNVRTKQK